MSKTTKSKGGAPATPGRPTVPTEETAAAYYKPAAARVVAREEFHDDVCLAVNDIFHDMLAREAGMPEGLLDCDEYGDNLTNEVAVIALKGAISGLQRLVKAFEDEGRRLGKSTAWPTHKPAAASGSVSS